MGCHILLLHVGWAGEGRFVGKKCWFWCWLRPWPLFASSSGLCLCLHSFWCGSGGFDGGRVVGVQCGAGRLHGQSVLSNGSSSGSWCRGHSLWGVETLWNHSFQGRVELNQPFHGDSCFCSHQLGGVVVRALHVGNGSGNAPCDEVGVGKLSILTMAYVDSGLTTWSPMANLVLVYNFHLY